MRTISFSAVIIFLCLSSSCFPQDNSSRAPQQPDVAPAAPSKPEVRTKRRTAPEVEEAMNKGRELLFQKQDAKASIEEFKKVIKLDPWYGQGYLLLGLAQMQLQHWSE